MHGTAIAADEAYMADGSSEPPPTAPYQHVDLAAFVPFDTIRRGYDPAQVDEAMGVAIDVVSALRAELARVRNEADAERERASEELIDLLRFARHAADLVYRDADQRLQAALEAEEQVRAMHQAALEAEARARRALAASTAHARAGRSPLGGGAQNV